MEKTPVILVGGALVGEPISGEHFLGVFFLFSFSTFGTRPHATDTAQLPNLFPRPLVFGEAAESYVRLGTAIQQQSTDSNKEGCDLTFLFVWI